MSQNIRDEVATLTATERAKFSSAFSRYRAAFSHFSVLEIIIVSLVLIVVLWYFWGGVTDWWGWHKATAQAAASQREAAQWKEKADAAQADALIKTGEANLHAQEAEAYRKQSEQNQQLAQQALDALAQSHTRTQTAQTNLNNIRRAPVRRTGTLDERSKRLSTDLDRALSNNP
jgi:hypothetical protein